MSIQLQRSTPEAQGIASGAILAFVEALEKAYLEQIHSLMLVRHGQVVAEGWWKPYAPQHPHELFSLSKSFTATAIGLAVAEGRLSLDDAVVSFFPDDAPPKVSANLAAMRVRDLLTMSTGHGQDSAPHLFKRRDGNWVKAFLKLPVRYKPGTHFIYNTGATYMLSAILQKLTGITLLDYLQPRLFEPLGIENPTWEVCPRGISTGGFGLSIKTEDIAKFGQLYLQKGWWQGRQILPAGWVDEATAYQIDNRPNKSLDWAVGYGYQFWRCQPPNAYRADGAFGQFCIVLPDQDAVLVLTAGAPDTLNILKLAWELLLPAFEAAPLAEAPQAQTALAQKLSGLAIAPVQGQLAVMEPPTGKYNFAANKLRLKSVDFSLTAEGVALTLRDTHGKHRILCGDGQWIAGNTAFLQRRFAHPVTAAAVWTAEQTYTVKLCFYEQVTCATLIFRFTEQRILLDIKLNVNFGPTEWLSMMGERGNRRRKG